MMPIKAIVRGLTDRGNAFPEIGSIRKGEKKQQGRIGKDLDYFRVEFASSEVKAASDFEAAFGDKPREFVAMIPFDEIDRCWDFWREAYVRAGGKGGGTLIHRCDGEHIEFARDPRTKEITVLNGRCIESGQRLKCGGLVHSYTGKDGKQREIRCKQVGRLRLIVPALMRAAYLMLHTTSWYDIENITSNLDAIKALNGGRIVAVPLRVFRRMTERNTPFGRREMSLVYIEADPAWVEAKLREMHSRALPNGGDIPMIAPPADWEDGNDEIVEPDEVIEGEVAEGKPEQQAMMPVETAMKIETPKGTPMGELDLTQLEEIKRIKAGDTSSDLYRASVALIDYLTKQPESEEPQGVEHSWDAQLIAMIVDAGLAKHEKNAVFMLNLSDQITPSDSIDVLYAWASEYRSHRNADKSKEESARLADETLRASVEDPPF